MKPSGISANAVEIAQLEFAWPSSPPLLSIADLTIARGERVFVKGASGSGKSTLLGMIGGVLTPQRGHITVMDTSLDVLPAAARDRFRADHVGFIFQMFNLVPYLTALANVLLPLRFSARRRRNLVADENTEARKLLAALGLSDEELIRRSVVNLSIGQQQRIAAARALIGRPDLIIADEPTSALDAEARADFLRLLIAECSAAGSTLLFVSHDASLGTFFDRTLTMDQISKPFAH